MEAKTLIEKLKQLDPKTEIRIAVMPNYPFACRILNKQPGPRWKCRLYWRRLPNRILISGSFAGPGMDR